LFSTSSSPKLAQKARNAPGKILAGEIDDDVIRSHRLPYRGDRLGIHRLGSIDAGDLGAESISIGRRTANVFTKSRSGLRLLIHSRLVARMRSQAARSLSGEKVGTSALQRLHKSL